MPNPEWGTKRLCPACATRFYDLGNDPTTCPACGVEHPLTAFVLSKGKSARAEAEKKAKEVKDPVVDDADDVLDDDDDDIAVDDDTVLDDDDDDASDIEGIADVASEDDDN